MGCEESPFSKKAAAKYSPKSCKLVLDFNIELVQYKKKQKVCI